jgi:hypothetical protein
VERGMEGEAMQKKKCQLLYMWHEPVPHILLHPGLIS